MKKKWICSCGNTVIAEDYPNFPNWSDGHRCSFTEVKNDIL